MLISEKIRAIAAEAEIALAPIFADIDNIALTNTEHVLDVFRENRVSESYFAASTGYGYGDVGRDAIDRICAGVFRAEAGFMRHDFVSGTHALTVGLFALLRPGDVMLSATGLPYDTMLDVVGIDENGEKKSDGTGSLTDFGVSYRQIAMTETGVDTTAVCEAVKGDPSVKIVYVQRSKGYLSRPTLTTSQIRNLANAVKRAAADAGRKAPFVVVDNCYGEFTELYEPCYCGDGVLGADMIIGSLIKNPGGGMADCGGYIAGSEKAVELAGFRLVCPGVGLEAGASLGQNRNILRGLFLAPHVVSQAMKTAHLAAYVFDSLGYKVYPSPTERRSDIIQTVECATGDGLIKFCRGIQGASPVDAHVTPMPWAMPGYADEVIMAAGAFVGGSSIELSCDGPMRPPFTAFLQGGMTYEAGKLGVLSAATEMTKS
ncbi:MAG: methionine gamma-lyase family protein [Clostridia bacterium]|nr:methionine gamma-lyase family protein [Clostridia bacterium]